MQLVNYVILLTEAAFIHKRPPSPSPSPPSPSHPPAPLVSVSLLPCQSLSLSLSLPVCPAFSVSSVESRGVGYHEDSASTSSTMARRGVPLGTGAPGLMLASITIPHPHPRFWVLEFLSHAAAHKAGDLEGGRAAATEPSLLPPSLPTRGQPNLRPPWDATGWQRERHLF